MCIHTLIKTLLGLETQKVKSVQSLVSSWFNGGLNKWGDGTSSKEKGCLVDCMFNYLLVQSLYGLVFLYSLYVLDFCQFMQQYQIWCGLIFSMTSRRKHLTHWSIQPQLFLDSKPNEDIHIDMFWLFCFLIWAFAFLLQAVFNSCIYSGYLM